MLHCKLRELRPEGESNKRGKEEGKMMDQFIGENY